MLRAGILELLSLKIYGDPMHLVHLFEDIHFMLFFVMLLFLLEAVVLVKSAMKVPPEAWPSQRSSPPQRADYGRGD